MSIRKEHYTLRLFTSILLLMLFIPVSQLMAQKLSGHVYDVNHNPIPGTQIYITALNQGTVTNKDGYFVLKNLPQGTYEVQISYVGYKKKILRLDLSKINKPITVTLTESTLELPGLTVTGTPQPTDILSSSQSISVVNAKDFEKESGATAMSALQNVSGVTLLSTGSGVDKPVIHGLSSERVVVAVNGVRQEAQNWGSRHGPEIDPFNVKKIEVVKGPGSVLYGAGALGGVVNVLSPDLPVSNNRTPLMAGSLDLAGFSNNNQGAGALMFHGASGSIGYRAEFSHRNAGNIQTPDGALFNSGLRKTNGNFMVGTSKKWGTLSLDYSHLFQRIEIHENPANSPKGTPNQPLHNDLLHLKANIPTHSLRFEINAAYQHNDRQEFPEAGAQHPGLHLVLNTSTINIKAHHAPLGPVYGTFGVSSMIQTNRTLATEKLIPGYNQQDYAAFIFEQAKFGPLNLSAGGRYDTRNLDVLSTPDLGVPAVKRKYNAFSGSFGAALHLTSNFSLTANIGRAWRAPTVFELFANGVHEGTLRYEVGDSNLVPELATNIQSSLKYVSSHFIGEISVYNNHISNYIFPNETSRIDSKSGFHIYDVTQANARIRGIDASLQVEATKWLTFNGGYSMLRGDNLAIHSPLPYMPANHGRIGFRLSRTKWGTFEEPYFSLHTTIYAKQTRLAANEPETAGYALVDFSTGSNVHVGKTALQLNLIVTNLFNKAYIDHLSTYRDFALNPGRNIVLKIKIPFNVIKK